MDYEHEVVVPRAGMPFKIERFEGATGNYIRKPHWHNSVEIFAIYEGSLDFILGEKILTVASGAFIIINTNELHSIRAQKHNFAIYLQIPINEFKNYLTGDHFISFHKKGKGAMVHSTQEELQAHEKEMMKLIRSIYELCGTSRAGHEYEMLRDYYSIMQLLVTVYRQEEPDARLYRSSKALRRLSPITEYIKVHYAEELSLQSLAEQFGYSIEHLSRIFQKYAKINYKTYLSAVRLEHALEEMDKGDRTIGEIASAVGFSDSRAMAKAFSRAFGMLPSEYMRRRRRENS